MGAYGNVETGPDDQLSLAVVSVRTVDGGVDERKISFVGIALEMAFEVISTA